MGSVQSVQACQKCEGIYEEVFYYKEGRSSGFCPRCGYSVMTQPASGQTHGSIQQNGLQVDKMEMGGYGVLSFAGEGHILDNGTPETLAKAKQLLEEYAEDGHCQFLTGWVDGKFVCLAGNMPMSYADWVKLEEEEQEKRGKRT